MVRVRFAPSPTGALHIGGARTALFNYLFAKQNSGTFILRIDDTDKERSLVEHEKNIISSLKWLGLNWDEGVDALSEPYAPYRQSARMDKHLALAEALRKTSAAYQDEEGCVRLKYPSKDIVVNDIICGECRFAPDTLGPDPVILRSDGTPTYHLASVADDIDMKISHVIRGQDHLTNTAKHIVLFEAAGAVVPKFAHLPLILGEDGSKLSKRNSTGFTTVTDFINAGYLPQSLMNFLSLLGWSHPDSIDLFSIESIVDKFTLERVNHTGAKFEMSKLDWFNGQYIRSIDSEELSKITLPWTGKYKDLIEKRGTKYWTTAITSLKTDFDKLNQVENVANLLLSESIEVSEEARSYFMLPENFDIFSSVKKELLDEMSNIILEDGSDSLSLEQIKYLTKHVKKKLDCPPKLIFQSIRVLTTGALKGAELDILLPHVPREILKTRIENCIIKP